MAEIKAFEFKQCVNILKSTGRKAGNLHDLRDAISKISDKSIIHHTYHYFLKVHVFEYTNDFAHWTGESLEERALSEHLSNIDPYGFENVKDLRNELLNVIDNYLKQFPEPRAAMHDDEFYFNETITLIFPANVRAGNLAEFLLGIRHVDPASIYYHFYEARARLKNRADDFSTWIEDSLKKDGLAERIRAIDPFMHNIEGIRGHIVMAVEEEVKNDMELIR